MTTSPEKQVEKPFSVQINLTFVAADLETAEAIVEKEILAETERLGMNGEDVYIHQMTPNEVIPGSPLDNALRSLPSKVEAPDA